MGLGRQAVRGGERGGGQTVAGHLVAPGETLSGIAAGNGLSTAALAAATGLSPEAHVISGSTLTVPAASAAVDRPLPAAIPDRVSPGATRWPAAGAEVVGSSAAVRSAAPARRAVRSMGMA